MAASGSGGSKVEGQPAASSSSPPMGDIDKVKGKAKVEEVDITIEEIDVALGAKKRADIISTTVYRQVEAVAKYNPDIAGGLAFLWVQNEHPDWMYFIIDTARKVYEEEFAEEYSGASSPQPAVRKLLEIIFSICSIVQQIAAALPKLELTKLALGSLDTSEEHYPQSKTTLLQALALGAAVMNPYSPLILGLQMRLFAAGIRTLLAAGPFQELTEQEALDLSALKIQGIKDKIDMINSCRGWLRPFEMKIGAKVLGTGGDLAFKFTENPFTMHTLDRAGMGLIKEVFNEKPGAHLRKHDQTDVLRDRHFFMTHPGYCAVWAEEATKVEMYRIAFEGPYWTALELVQTLEDIPKFQSSKWLAAQKQVYRMVTDGKSRRLQGVGEDRVPWSVRAPLKMQKTAFDPLTPAGAADEAFLTKVLEESGIPGGSWNLLESGFLPSQAPLGTGFRMAQMSFAVAGLGAWFPGNVFKGAAVLEFPNVTMRDGKNLKLGTVMQNAQHPSSLPVKPKPKVKVTAARDSRLWDSPVMWG